MHALHPRHQSRRTAAPDSLDSAGQRPVADFPMEDAVPVPLRAGEFPIHRTLAVHASGPNRADDRRLGAGISRIPVSVRPVGSARASATLVRGADRHGHFDPEPRPADGLDRETCYGRRAGCSAGDAEQVEWRAAGRRER